MMSDPTRYFGALLRRVTKFTGSRRAVLALMLCATVAFAPRANAAGLDMKHLQKVAHLGVTVFYPTYVPARFSSAVIHTSSETSEGIEHFDYSLQFCNKTKVCFSVESAWCGIGDGPDGDRAIHGTSTAFGPFSIDVYNPWSEGNGTAERYYVSQWLDPKSTIEILRGHHCPAGPERHYVLLGNGISDKEAVAIVASMKPLE